MTVNKRQQHLPKPGELLAHNVDDKLRWEVIAYRGIQVKHQRLETCWQGVVGFCWKDAHQLLEGLEWLTQREHGVGLWDVDVCEERAVMEGVEPVPTRDSFVVIQTNPLQSLQKLLTDAALKLQELSGLDSELLRVILLLVRINIMVESRVVIQTDLRGDSLLDLLLERAQ